MEYFCVITLETSVPGCVYQVTKTMVATVEGENHTAQELFKQVMAKCVQENPDADGGAVIFYSVTPNAL